MVIPEDESKNAHFYIISAYFVNNLAIFYVSTINQANSGNNFLIFFAIKNNKGSVSQRRPVS
jgi:hypothetical protein